MPRGIIQVSPRDSGSLTQEWANATDEGEPGGAEIEGARAYLVSPPFMIQQSSLSKTGPVVIRPGQSYAFDLRYEIDASAPYGCFRAFIKFETPDGGVIPDPDDDPTPVDFVVLPSTGSPGRTWTRLRSSLNCRRRLAAAERPDLRAGCRRRVQALLKRGEIRPEVFWFTEVDRSRAHEVLSKVVAEAHAGSIPAILELGYRTSSASRKALRHLAGGAIEQDVTEELAREVYECEAGAQAAVGRRFSVWQASRQALARLGDAEMLRVLKEDIVSTDPARVEAAAAAWAYIGGGEARTALSRALLTPNFPVPLQFSVVRALEAVELQEDARIKAAFDSPDERVSAWRAWAETSHGR